MTLSRTTTEQVAFGSCLDPKVFVARSPSAAYRHLSGVSFPEFPSEPTITTSLVALRELLNSACWDVERYGEKTWNPLGSIVPPGARVLLKPNWVRHPVPGRDDGDSLVTHTHVIDALLAYLTKVPDCRVIIGDAPIQGCNFEKLLAVNGITDMVARHAGRFTKLEVVDFRKTVLGREGQDGRVRRDCRGDEHFVLFDLGSDSLLEAVTTPEPRFRVTVYNPDHLARTHHPGRHQYLVAKEVLEADVVFNLPKLKTHKKACLTGALKNMVGINGHKEYLPHHRLGGTADGGDCYPGKSRLKALAERLLDAGNRTEHRRKMRLASLVAGVSLHLNQLLGGDDNLEGSWFGNDTVWRMCLDLQRILHYGKTDGTLAATPQRTVLTITDAVIAGQGEGPLSPTPCPMGLLTLGRSTAAVEYVHALIMGLDPARIPLVLESLTLREWPLITGGTDQIRVCWSGRWLLPHAAGRELRTRVIPPKHWQGHCELAD
jgi:uncharacterized protein (DUF362 family)